MKGQSWSLWCSTHGGYRGPIAWGNDEPEVPPCPKCGEETPDTYTENYVHDPV